MITSAYPETLKPKNNHPPLMSPSGNIHTFLDYYSYPSDKFSGVGFYGVPHLQFQLTKIHNNHEHQAVVNAGGHMDKARLRSCKGNKSSKWMMPAPVGRPIG